MLKIVSVLPDEVSRLVFPTYHVTISKLKNGANLLRKWPVLELYEKTPLVFLTWPGYGTVAWPKRKMKLHCGKTLIR